MKVSVIIPNYNHAAYLEKRIESVLNQSYSDYEVILLDDCSTDNSVSIMQRYKSHPKVAHVCCNKSNSGSTFKQWEKGVKLTSAEHVWIAESDDYADRNFLANAMERFSNDKTLGLYFCDYYSIDQQGNIIQPDDTYPREFVQRFAGNKIMNGKYFCEHYLFFSNLILNASAVVFRKDLFINADRTYTDLKIAGDWRMWVNICYNTSIFFDEKKLNFFRMHSQNVRSLKSSMMGAEAVRNLVYFVKKTPDKALQKKLKESICKLWVYSFYLNKDLHLNLALIKSIMVIDVLFPLRLTKRIAAKFLRRRLNSEQAIKMIF